MSTTSDRARRASFCRLVLVVPPRAGRSWLCVGGARLRGGRIRAPVQIGGVREEHLQKALRVCPPRMGLDLDPEKS